MCDGSGVLTVAASVEAYKRGETWASWCHGCLAGEVWKEAGLGE